MKRIILGILTIVLLSGCSATYNLKIEDNKFIEGINTEFDNDVLKEYGDGYYFFDDEFKQNAFFTPNNDNYNSSKENIDIDVKQNDKSFIVNTNYIYSDNNFDDAYLLNYCFDVHKFTNGANYYELAIGGKFHCQYSADKIDLIITTDYAVTNTNAKVKDNKYIWTLTNDNNEDVDIYIRMLKETSKDKFLSKFKIYCSIIFAVLILISLIIYVKHKKKND